MKHLTLAIRFFPVAALAIGCLCGAVLWNANQPVAQDSILMWAWVAGGMISLVGGVYLVSRARCLALICIFGAFVVLLAAATFLPAARRMYEEQRGHSWHGVISIH